MKNFIKVAKPSLEKLTLKAVEVGLVDLFTMSFSFATNPTDVLKENVLLKCVLVSCFAINLFNFLKKNVFKVEKYYFSYDFLIIFSFFIGLYKFDFIPPSTASLV